MLGDSSASHTTQTPPIPSFGMAGCYGRGKDRVGLLGMQMFSPVYNSMHVFSEGTAQAYLIPPPPQDAAMPLVQALNLHSGGAVLEVTFVPLPEVNLHCPDGSTQTPFCWHRSEQIQVVGSRPGREIGY